MNSIANIHLDSSRLAINTIAQRSIFFGPLALLLAGMGLHAVTSYAATELRCRN